MKIIRSKLLKYQSASHEDPSHPGSLKKVLLTYKNLLKGRIQMINWAKILPEKSFRSHYHEDLEEIFIILSGRAKLLLDKQTVILHKGDVAVIPCKKIHRMINLSREATYYLAIGITKKGTGATVVV